MPGRARRRGRHRDRHRRADAREGAAVGGGGGPRRSRSTSATSSTCRTTTPRFDVLVSNFGLVFAPDHANVAVGAGARHATRRQARLHRLEAEPEARRALPPLHRGADRGPRGLRVGPRGPRRGHARRRLRARVRGRHALARGGVGRGDLEALLGVGAAGDRAPAAASTPGRREEFHQAFVELYEGYRTDDGGVRAPRRYLLVLGRRK